MQVFSETMPFFKGNLHCHTTISDGARSPAEAIALYRSMGYDFLTITDHRKTTVAQSHLEAGMLVFSGIELDYLLSSEVVHLVGFGMTENVESRIRYEQGPQAGAACIRACGGRVIAAHPHWSLNTAATLMAIRGVTAAEVFNSMSFARPDSSHILDVMAARGAMLPFVASDDTHAYAGEQGMACTMVQAEALTPEAILEAMDAGRFYASQGPRIEQITLADGMFTVRCSPAAHIYFHTNLPWTPGRIVNGAGLTEASYQTLPGRGECFVRCQVIDAAGKSAWSNPLPLGTV